MPPLSLGGNVGGWSSADAELRDQVSQEHVDQVAEDPQPGAPQCVEAGRDGIARGPSQLRWLVRQVRRECGDGLVHGRDRDRPSVLLYPRRDVRGQYAVLEPDVVQERPQEVVEAVWWGRAQRASIRAWAVSSASCGVVVPPITEAAAP